MGCVAPINWCRISQPSTVCCLLDVSWKGYIWILMTPRRDGTMEWWELHSGNYLKVAKLFRSATVFFVLLIYMDEHIYIYVLGGLRLQLRLFRNKPCRTARPLVAPTWPLISGPIVSRCLTYVLVYKSLYTMWICISYIYIYNLGMEHDTFFMCISVVRAGTFPTWDDH